jgi:hypothetical protein
MLANKLPEANTKLANEKQMDRSGMVNRFYSFRMKKLK